MFLLSLIFLKQELINSSKYNLQYSSCMRRSKRHNMHIDKKECLLFREDTPFYIFHKKDKRGDY